MERAGRFLTSAAAWILPAALILTWEIATREKLLPPSQSAAPSQVVQRLVRLLFSGELIRQALYSTGRLATGVVLGGIVGVCAGVFMALSRKIELYFSPTLQFLAPIPVIVWIPFLIMFFGLGEVSKIALVSLCTFFLVHVHTFYAMRSVERDYLELASVYEKTHLEKIKTVFLPFALPSILTALRVSLALGWVVLFVIEYAYSSQRDGGLGWFIADARGFGRVEDQFAGVVLLGLIGFGSDRSVVLIQKYLLRWSDSFEMSIG
jgi:sulfonate transport system permease protein